MRTASLTILAFGAAFGCGTAFAAPATCTGDLPETIAAPSKAMRMADTWFSDAPTSATLADEADDAELNFSGVEAQGDAAFEDEMTEGGWTFSGRAGMTSDYRYRGVSLTNREPAMQADFTFASTDGLYFFGWASQFADNGGENVELMGAVGWAGAFFTDAITLDASAGFYAYPGVNDSTLFELSAKFTQEVGDFTVVSGFSYMPEQANLGDLDDTYMTLSVGHDLGFWDASGSVGLGWEDGAFGSGKVDWIAAVDVPIEDFTLRVAYAGAERHFYGSNGGATIFAELKFNFGSSEE